ncbi:MAG: aspartate ammonia-lyase [Acidobacteriia bacterium]|nr:aspartate ammonia-lyase [Terriglobia bacterium]
MEYRTERDSLGEVQVPASSYYGAQTARALENYPISGMRVHPAMVENYVLLKKAAAEVLQELGLLDAERGKAIVQAAEKIMGGVLRDQFVVDVFHSGAGTSFHMNVNEVLAGCANEILTGKRGGNSPVHPNDHVNMAQSTNDTFPTVMRMAARRQVPSLTHVLSGLSDAMGEKAAEFKGVVKAGRTHLQDAVPITLGQEFAAYAETVRQASEAIASASRALEELGIGGSAVGTGLNTPPRFRFRVVDKISRYTGIDFRPAGDLRAGMQSNLPIVLLSSSLRVLALEVSRICNDLRLLSSGPATGLMEINLPAAQPGSSIMPGKVNPSIPEMVNMVCFQVIGNDTALVWADGAGQLELNVMMPVMAHNLLQSLQILTNSLRILTSRCIAGITADAGRCRRFAESSTALATVLNPRIGYDRAAEIVKEALASGRTVVEVAREKSGLSEDELHRLFDMAAMTGPAQQ